MTEVVKVSMVYITILGYFCCAKHDRDKMITMTTNKMICDTYSCFLNKISHGEQTKMMVVITMLKYPQKFIITIAITFTSKSYHQ